MMTVHETGAGNRLEIHLTGQVTQDDYTGVLIPAVEAALAEHGTLRVLVVIDQGFTGYDAGAVWADTKLGLTHWRGFERIGLVTDTPWVAASARALALLVPCPVQVFSLAEAADARRWLAESLGAVHIRDLGGPSLEVGLLGRPDAEDFTEAERDLDARLRERDGFRLLLDLREFDGWQGLSAIAAHFSLVRQHAPLVQRIAMVGKNDWQKAALRIARQFINAEIRFFPSREISAARAWLGAD